MRVVVAGSKARLNAERAMIADLLVHSAARRVSDLRLLPLLPTNLLQSSSGRHYCTLLQMSMQSDATYNLT